MMMVMVMMMTPSEKVRPHMSYEVKSPARAGPMRLGGRGPLGRRGRPKKPSGPSKRLLAQRVISGGKTHVDQPSEGRRKKYCGSEHVPVIAEAVHCTVATQCRLSHLFFSWRCVTKSKKKTLNMF